MIEKKKSSISLEKNRMAFFSAGLILVSSLSLAAFEWKTLSVKEKFSDVYADDEVHMIEEEILTELPEPPKPQKIQPPAPQQARVSENIVIDERAKDDNNTVLTDINTNVDPGLEDIDFGGLGFDGPTDTDNEPFIVVEKMPSFPGGEVELMKFIQKNVNYPWAAKEVGQEGTAYIQFIVEKNGKITNVKCLRDIGFGIEDEAIRVVKKMPKWEPGEQRGNKVRVKFTIPIKFQLK